MGLFSGFSNRQSDSKAPDYYASLCIKTSSMIKTIDTSNFGFDAFSDEDRAKISFEREKTKIETIIIAFILIAIRLRAIAKNKEPLGNYWIHHNMTLKKAFHLLIDHGTNFQNIKNGLEKYIGKKILNSSELREAFLMYFHNRINSYSEHLETFIPFENASDENLADISAAEININSLFNGPFLGDYDVERIYTTDFYVLSKSELEKKRSAAYDLIESIQNAYSFLIKNLY